MQRQKLMEIHNNPASLYREVAVLYSLGLEDYEIQYLLHEKVKELARRKWENQAY